MEDKNKENLTERKKKNERGKTVKKPKSVLNVMREKRRMT